MVQQGLSVAQVVVVARVLVLVRVLVLARVRLVGRVRLRAPVPWPLVLVLVELWGRGLRGGC